MLSEGEQREKSIQDDSIYINLKSQNRGCLWGAGGYLGAGAGILALLYFLIWVEASQMCLLIKVHRTVSL